MNLSFSEQVIQFS